MSSIIEDAVKTHAINGATQPKAGALHAISVDVEEYFHAANVEPYIGRAEWSKVPSRVEESIEQTLQILDMRSTKATFFILGLVAEKFPELVKKIATEGHEIASHGYEHRLAYSQTEQDFLTDVSKSKRLLEDCTGEPIRGYRAPNFSIVESNQWAYDALLTAGYRYDSSVYPVWHPRYANVGKPAVLTLVGRTTGNLIEVPLATFKFKAFGHEYRLPIAGGAYWRLMPKFLIRGALERAIKNDNLSAVCYFHPWELDAAQPQVKEMHPLTKIRHYAGIPSFGKKLDEMLQNFRFTSIWDLLDRKYTGLLDQESQVKDQQKS